jgi:hypothetical protein
MPLNEPFLKLVAHSFGGYVGATYAAMGACQVPNMAFTLPLASPNAKASEVKRRTLESLD